MCMCVSSWKLNKGERCVIVKLIFCVHDMFHPGGTKRPMRSSLYIVSMGEGDVWADCAHLS